MNDTSDFFRNRLDQIIYVRHPAAVLASRILWQEIGASIESWFANHLRVYKTLADIDLIGSTVSVIGACVFRVALPRLPTCLMLSLRYLEHVFNYSDVGVNERWASTHTRQYFSGFEYFVQRWPSDPSLLVRYRRLLGEESVEELMARIINVAVILMLIDVAHRRTLLVDSTVQEKAITYLTDIETLETARGKLGGTRCRCGCAQHWSRTLLPRRVRSSFRRLTKSEKTTKHLISTAGTLPKSNASPEERSAPRTSLESR